MNFVTTCFDRKEIVYSFVKHIFSIIMFLGFFYNILLLLNVDWLPLIHKH
jgi:hypothetical protein